MRNFWAGASLAAMAIVSSTSVYAQETTATLRGEVANDANAPVANATVTITHTPSGTRSVQTTDANGQFNATGLRIGGPYSVVVTAPGFEPATTDLDTLQAGQPSRIAVAIFPEGQTITVTGSRQARSAITVASGPSTTLNRDQILGVATINRDIRDLARRDPLVTLDPTNSRAISIAGQNNRFNRITVDGVLFGDPFGLNNGGLASQRGPVPIDAICQFSVEVAPADIQQGNFQGGAINTQLCSGTNEFHGSGFYTYSDDGLAGDRSKPVPSNLAGRYGAPFTNKNFGGQVTGPLIKDKLFFAVTYEQLNASSTAPVGPANEGFSNQVANISRAQISQIQGIVRGSRYKYDPLDVASAIPEFDQKLVLKLDYNIAEGHRVFGTYIYNYGTSLSGTSTPSIFANSNPTLALQSNNYSATEENHYGVVQFNDAWSDVFSTQVRASFNDYKRGQVPYNGRDFGQLTVCLDPTSAGSPTTCTPGQAQIAVGPDISRQANALRVKTYAIEAQAQIKLNDHSVKIIAERREQDINNIFQQNVSGAFYFDSVADLAAGKAGSLTYATPINGDINSGAAIFHNINYTFGVQDVWDTTNDLTLIYGFRYDLYDANQRPPANSTFISRYGFANNYDLQGKGKFQPRTGFTYGPGDRLRLRGSAGLYAGGSPNVWVANSYANPGTAVAQLTSAQRSTTSATGFSSNIVGFNGLSAQQIGSAALDNVTGGTGIPSVITQFVQRQNITNNLANAISPDFKIPAQWRYALSGDYKLDLGRFGDGWGLGGDVVYSDVQQAVTWTDIRSVQNGTLPDGRPRYREINGGTSNAQDVLITNTKKGHSLNLVARASKDFDFGLSLGASYTYQRARDVNSGTSSVALSNYTQTAALDPNQSAYGISNYQIDNTIKLSAGFSHNFFKDVATRIDLFFESRSGQRYSYTVQDLTSGRSAVFGTTSTNNRYLAYIPTSPTDAIVSYGQTTNSAGVVTQTAAQASALLDTLISSSILNDYRGGITPKNIGKSPRFNKLDLHISQEIPFFRQTKFEAFADIENVLNLINKNWGSLREVAFPYYGTIANITCLQTAGGAAATSSSQPCAQYQYSNVRSAQLSSGSFSLWQIRVGGRFKF